MVFRRSLTRLRLLKGPLEIGTASFFVPERPNTDGLAKRLKIEKQIF
jgi:hypothetical protein